MAIFSSFKKLVGPQGFKPTSANFRDPTDRKFKAKPKGKSDRSQVLEPGAGCSVGSGLMAQHE